MGSPRTKYSRLKMLLFVLIHDTIVFLSISPSLKPEAEVTWHKINGGAIHPVRDVVTNRVHFVSCFFFHLGLVQISSTYLQFGTRLPQSESCIPDRDSVAKYFHPSPLWNLKTKKTKTKKKHTHKSYTQGLGVE